MKKSYSPLWYIVLVLALVTAGCSKKKVTPLSERIAKTWTAEAVKEGTVVVYTRGGSSNTRPAYSAFRLTLTNTGGVQTATYTEFDGNTFTGTWALEGETVLTLTGLTPAPTGSGGTIKFTITSVADTKLVLTRLSTSPKTGNTTNEYTLSNP